MSITQKERKVIILYANTSAQHLLAGDKQKSYVEARMIAFKSWRKWTDMKGHKHLKELLLIRQLTTYIKN